MRFKGLFLSLLLLTPFFFPADVTAFDNRCFTQSECKEERTKIGSETIDPNDGFYQSQETVDACGGLNKAGNGDQPGEPLGFCLPVGQTVTAITFGGRNQFAHLGEFIQYMYQYGFVIGTIIATLVIIVAGFQWTVSGGNTAVIQSAQKRIGGAVVGLLIMAMSYTILNTINPRTVTLRLPQIWMINPAELAPNYCDQTDKKTAFFREQEEELSTRAKEDRVKRAVYQDQKTSPTKCQSKYLVEDSGDLTCRGVVCPNIGSQRQVCAPSQKDISKDECYRGDLALTYRTTNFKLIPDIATEVWDDPPIDGGETELHGLCIAGKTFEIATTVRYQQKGNAHTELILIKEKEKLEKTVESSCGSKAGFKGFFFIVEMNENNDTTDEDHYIGRNGKDLGDDATFTKVKFSDKITPHLFTLEEMVEGKIHGQLVQVNNVYDIDSINPLSGLSGDDLRKKVYKDIGFE